MKVRDFAMMAIDTKLIIKGFSSKLNRYIDEEFEFAEESWWELPEDVKQLKIISVEAKKKGTIIISTF